MNQARPLRVTLSRGDHVESEHLAALAVVDRTGRLVASAGDADRFAYFRSSAKPFQAMPLVESGAADAFGFTESELAFCCSSHNGQADQQQAVVAMLDKIGADPGMLQCGAALPLDAAENARLALGLVPASPLQNCCSGKHTGMLATCLHLGYPVETYLEPDHPLQRSILANVTGAMRRDPASIALAADGCSVPTFGATVTDFARSYAALAAPAASPSETIRRQAATINRLTNAMTAYPESIAGKGELDTELMRLSNGEVVVKIGAEGLLCQAVPAHGVGIAIRIEDGTYRGLNILAISALEQLQLVDADAISAMKAALIKPITNANGWVVGQYETSLAL